MGALMSNKVHIAAQIMELQRELEMRRRVYPEQVRRGKMKAAQADLHIHQMEAAILTLQFVQEHEHDFRAYMAEKKEKGNA